MEVRRHGEKKNWDEWTKEFRELSFYLRHYRDSKIVMPQLEAGKESLGDIELGSNEPG